MTHPLSMPVLAQERRSLTNLAYRLLGSLADAEDVVQETYARWFALSDEERRAIEAPAAWLTRVAGRICLDELRSARHRRERYVGEWLPEPLPDDGAWLRTGSGSSAADPADRITLDESVAMAFLVVLDAMTPPERVAFILHDVFGYRFAEVGQIVGRTPGACRQLASSARGRLRASQAPATAVPAQAAVIRQFKKAWEAQDITALLAILDPTAVAIADGGGRVSAELRPIHGKEQIARTVIDLARTVPGLTLIERTVNGLPGLVLEQDGAIVTVMAFEVAGSRIRRIWAVRNPEKLRAWTG